MSFEANGWMIPDLPPDDSAHPYKTVFAMDEADVNVMLSLTDTKFVVYSDTLDVDAPTSFVALCAINNEWLEAERGTLSSGNTEMPISAVIWSNYDILYKDGTVAFPSSVSNADDDWFRKLFINEAKAALSANGFGGSIEGLDIPTKLSDLKNDLYGEFREEVFSITGADLKYDADYEMLVCVLDHDISWLKSDSDAGYHARVVTPTDTIEVTEDDVPHSVQTLPLNGTSVPIMEAMGGIVMIAPYFTPDRSSFDLSRTMAISDPDIADEITDASFTLYHKYTKKIPIGLCDTDEVESAIVSDIDALTEEVNAL